MDEFFGPAPVAQVTRERGFVCERIQNLPDDSVAPSGDYSLMYWRSGWGWVTQMTGGWQHAIVMSHRFEHVYVMHDPTGGGIDDD